MADEKRWQAVLQGQGLIKELKTVSSARRRRVDGDGMRDEVQEFGGDIELHEHEHRQVRRTTRGERTVHQHGEAHTEKMDVDECCETLGRSEEGDAEDASLRLRGQF